MKKADQDAILEKLAEKNGVTVEQARRELELALQGTEYEGTPIDEAIVLLAKKAVQRMK